jgi:hypothetical protein
MVPPQPSVCMPQLAPSKAHVTGVHAGAPHTFGDPPPPQVVLAGQAPQSMMFPQPSLRGPQLAPTPAQVCGRQTPASLG